MFRLFVRLIVWLVRTLFRSREDLMLVNLALRKQLAIFKDKKPRPRLSNPARAFWVGLRDAWPRWKNALHLVKPDTVVSWHRRGFRLFWRLKSKWGKVGRPPISPEIRDLIRRMATENGWGAPRIHGELRKLGFDVSERTVSRYLPKRPVPQDAVKRWLAAQSPGRHRRSRFPHRPDGDFQPAVRLLRHPPRPAADPAFRHHRPPVRRVGGAAVA
jgi:hypothetical protein